MATGKGGLVMARIVLAVVRTSHEGATKAVHTCSRVKSSQVKSSQVNRGRHEGGAYLLASQVKSSQHEGATKAVHTWPVVEVAMRGLA